ncbi:DNA (cytosine-5-)-methyltransferase [Limnobacter sp. SAORIC-690]|jgi:DNA (cytosine-5)-methyltransferase 1|nr:DNA cytosine methyltransferase [Limnobacter sp. SAORIC-690]PQJ24563.1 DNA (cytosine-5-)-methyltransferase [Limnobacter sp. SAORIC-690]SMG62147.1 DNA (cytosine-5-)-methyltransferase [methanotrophic bacterial endosymbiont of Bathymodiolus sp.]
MVAIDNMKKPLRFADVFAGCGGLSLGLLEAGCQGVFAIERSPLAFETLRHNLVDGKRYQFDWPSWLPKQAMTCENLLLEHGAQLENLKGSIDLIVGGPPCQGFSTAGRRDPADPRNQMTEQYLVLVEKLQPRFLVIENVAGFNMRFETDEAFDNLIKNPNHTSYADYVAGRLEDLGYSVSRGLVNCADFGVPQNRLRYLVLCELNTEDGETVPSLFETLMASRKAFLENKGLPVNRKISVKEAIADLLVDGAILIESTDSDTKGFQETLYQSPMAPHGYLKLIRAHFGAQTPNSRRLAKHKKTTVEYFKKVQKTCRPGRCLTVKERAKVGTKKHSTTVLDPNSPAPTITTLPDDILHYCEPRILTVRENARIQSFPDWFEFQGKYTTGGKQRKQECPRYTQVGNAVPPLIADAIGAMLISQLNRTPTAASVEYLSETTNESNVQSEEIAPSML